MHHSVKGAREYQYEGRTEGASSALAPLWAVRELDQEESVCDKS